MHLHCLRESFVCILRSEKQIYWTIKRLYMQMKKSSVSLTKTLPNELSLTLYFLLNSLFYLPIWARNIPLRAKNSAVISLEKYFRLVDSMSSRPWKNYKRIIIYFFQRIRWQRILIYFCGSGDKEFADKQQPHVELGLYYHCKKITKLTPELMTKYTDLQMTIRQGDWEQLSVSYTHLTLPTICSV